MRVLDQKYELLREVGRGGMARVYEARHRITRRHVAVKWMSERFIDHPRASQRFVREAQAVTRIEHPHIVQLFDVGMAEGRPYLVMELLRGRPLSALLEERGTMPADELVTLLEPVFEALAHAHASGVVHRDVKPENLFLHEASDGSTIPKVVDFGVSMVLYDAEASKLTETRSVVGTPAFMAPEQAMGLSGIDARADVYALGVVLYRGLTGELPFVRNNYNALMLAIARDPVPPPISIRSDLSPAVSKVIERALVKNPKKRWPSVTAFGDALTQAVGDASRSAVLPGGPAARRPWVVGAAAGLLIAGGAWAGWHATQPRAEAESHAAAAPDLSSDLSRAATPTSGLAPAWTNRAPDPDAAPTHSNAASSNAGDAVPLAADLIAGEATTDDGNAATGLAACVDANDASCAAAALARWRGDDATALAALRQRDDAFVLRVARALEEGYPDASLRDAIDALARQSTASRRPSRGAAGRRGRPRTTAGGMMAAAPEHDAMVRSDARADATMAARRPPTPGPSDTEATGATTTAATSEPGHATNDPSTAPPTTQPDQPRRTPRISIEDFVR